jgi:hypothetical protein
MRCWIRDGYIVFERPLNDGDVITLTYKAGIPDNLQWDDPVFGDNEEAARICGPVMDAAIGIEVCKTMIVKSRGNADAIAEWMTKKAEAEALYQRELANARRMARLSNSGTDLRIKSVWPGR